MLPFHQHGSEKPPRQAVPERDAEDDAIHTRGSVGHRRPRPRKTVVWATRPKEAWGKPLHLLQPRIQRRPRQDRVRAGGWTVSRNLYKTDCHFCRGEVVKEEDPRPLTLGEAGVYWQLRDGYSYEGMICADAKCRDCGAKYLAWIDLSACAGYGTRSQTNPGGIILDLSFRSTFNDEPGNEDMPYYRIEKIVTLKKHPWPRCAKCGEKKVSENYCPNCFDTREVKP